MTEEQAQTVVETLTGLWESEFAATCKVLANVKEDNRDYKPDAKSRTAWEVATHLAAGDIWFLDSVIAGAFVYDPEAEKRTTSAFRTVNDVVEYYSREFPAKLAQVRALPAAHLARAVDFFGLMQRPNVTYLGFGNNHSVHHRGQLAAYLRAMGSTVPAIYGSSADEPMQAAAN